MPFCLDNKSNVSNTLTLVYLVTSISGFMVSLCLLHQFQPSKGPFRYAYSSPIYVTGLHLSESTRLFRYRNISHDHIDFTQNKNMWTYGEFWKSPVNGTLPQNPWGTESSNAPFGQDFYLILNVAVGGTQGWFP